MSDKKFTFIVVTVIFMAAFGIVFSIVWCLTQIPTRMEPTTQAEQQFTLPPPQVEVVSEWGRLDLQKFRYLKIDGRLALQFDSNVTGGNYVSDYGSVSFVPESPPLNLKAEAETSAP